MNNKPDRIWAWYDPEYEVVSGGLKKFPFNMAAEYIRADLVEPEIAFIREVSEADKIAIREAALREVLALCKDFPYVVSVENTILALIGEKK
jgi:hypothetical protein